MAVPFLFLYIYCIKSAEFNCMVVGFSLGAHTLTSFQICVTSIRGQDAFYDSSRRDYFGKGTKIMSHQIFVDSVRRYLEPILDKSGTILYSSCETLRPGKYYFLGLNPGGSEENTESVRKSLDGLGLGGSTTNAYLDQDWSSKARKYGVGGHPLQQNYRYLFEKLREEPDSVCASNLIFSRSVSEKGAGGREKAELCWPVHRAILKIVRPAAIITYGRQPFDFIIEKLGGTAPKNSPAGHGNWTWRYSILETGEKLIGLPHLSRYALRSHPDVVKEMRELIG